jgi:Protein of unknown function (DUF1761)
MEGGSLTLDEEAIVNAGINWLAVIAAAVSSFVVGGIWYGPLLGTVWMRASGMTPDKVAQARPGLVYGVSLVLQIIAAIVLAMFIGPEATFSFAVFAAASVGLFWVAPALGVIYLFEQRSLAHWAVNAGYQVVAFTLMGVILGLWK